MSELREDPYYPPQDPLWPAFEKWLHNADREGLIMWKQWWVFSEGFDRWWPYWLAFLAGVKAKETCQ